MNEFAWKKVIIIVIVLEALGGGIFLAFRAIKNREEASEKTIPKIDEQTAEDIAEEWLEQMDLKAKIGQMIIMTNEEKDVTETFLEELLEVKPGGYILMTPNITSYERTKQMLMEVDRVSREDYGVKDLPMILSVDEEGGNVQRLLYVEDRDATNIPYMYDVGKTGDEELAYKIGKVIGEETRSIGLNLTFAPDIDVFSNSENEVIGKRSFGEDKETVARMAIKVASGIEDVGVRTAYKHFPGHGDTAVDSHIALPIIDKSWEELEKVDLYPFKRAIETGAQMIMVGHIAVDGSEVPASLSNDAVTGILKKKMGFSGLVITDALNMGAVAENYTGAEIAVMAVEAGEDLLLMPASAREARDAVLSAVENGDILEARINESVKKILMYKAQYLKNFTSGSESDFGSEAHKKIVQQVTGNEQ